MPEVMSESSLWAIALPWNDILSRGTRNKRTAEWVLRHLLLMPQAWRYPWAFGFLIGSQVFNDLAETKEQFEAGVQYLATGAGLL